MNKEACKQLLRFVAEHRELLIELLRLLKECRQGDEPAA